MKLKLPIYLALLFCFALFGCAKRKAEKQARKELIAHTWTCQSVTDNGTPITEQCQVTDQLIFSEAGTGKNYFPHKCEPSDPYEIAFDWSLADDGKTIYLSNYDGYAGNNIDLSILQLSASTLDVKYTAANSHQIHVVYISR